MKQVGSNTGLFFLCGTSTEPFDLEPVHLYQFVVRNFALGPADLDLLFGRVYPLQIGQ